MAENYLIIGGDDFIKNREAVKIKNKFLQEEEAALGFSVHGQDDIEGLFDSLNTTPFLSGYRVVWFRDIQALEEGVMEKLVAYLDSPMDTSIFIMTADPAFKKNKMYKALSAKMKMMTADTPSKGTMKQWINAFFSKEGIKIDQQAVELISELKGDDTLAIRNELAKLCAFSEGKDLGVQDVEAIVGRSVKESVFKLVDSIDSKDALWAYRILRDLYEQKKQPSEIIGYLGWYLRTIQRIKSMKACGTSPGHMAKALGYSEGYIRRLDRQSQRHDRRKINKWLNLLLKTDREIKTGFRKPDLALDTIVAVFIGDRQNRKSYLPI